MDSNITFSPDGRKIAFMRYDNPDPGKYRLIVRSLESGEETVLASGLNSQAFYSPAWSPDGKTILCVVNQPGNALSGLMAIDVRNGQQHLVLSSDSGFVSATWMPEGNGLLALEKTRASNFTQEQIAYVIYPAGKDGPSHARHQQLFRSERGRERAGAGNGAQPRTLESGGNVGHVSLAPTHGQSGPAAAFTNLTWTHDGRLVYDKDNTLYWLNPDSGAKGTFATEQDSADGDPWECPDGHYVVFLLGLRGGESSENVWRADASGGNSEATDAGQAG